MRSIVGRGASTCAGDPPQHHSPRRRSPPPRPLARRLRRQPQPIPPRPSRRFHRAFGDQHGHHPDHRDKKPARSPSPPGLFEGARGDEAYAAGHRIHKAASTAAGSSLTAMTTPMRARRTSNTRIGGGEGFCNGRGFSLQDNFGGTVLAANPQVPNVAVSLDPSAVDLPNSFSPF